MRYVKTIKNWTRYIKNWKNWKIFLRSVSSKNKTNWNGHFGVPFTPSSIGRVTISDMRYVWILWIFNIKYTRTYVRARKRTHPSGHFFLAPFLHSSQCFEMFTWEYLKKKYWSRVSFVRGKSSQFLLLCRKIQKLLIKISYKLFPKSWRSGKFIFFFAITSLP